MELKSDLNHLKVFFAGAAIGAEPVFSHIFPAGAWSDTFFRTTFFFFIHPAADDAHPDFKFFAFI